MSAASSTAGKRRAAGPAVTGGPSRGGARKATGPARATVRPQPPAAYIEMPEPAITRPTPTDRPAAAAGSTPRRAAPPPGVRESVVRPDARLALEDAVTAAGEVFDPSGWSFDQSTFLVTIARRLNPVGQGRDRLLVSEESHTAWLTDGQDAEETAGRLARATPLARTQITWLLDEHFRFGTGPWLLRSLGTTGWLCSRRTRLGRTRHFIVATDGTCAPVNTGNRQAAAAALDALIRG